MNFDEHSESFCLAELAAGTIQSFRESNIINGIHAMKEPCRARCLVRLQVANQMPLAGQRRNFPTLPFPFLHSVLAKMNEACLECVANIGGRSCFRNANERDLICATTRAPR